jgi:hypothetical protein
LAIPLSGFGSLSKMLLFIFTQFIPSLSFIHSLCLSVGHLYVSLSLPSICLSGFFLLSATNYYNRSLSCGPMTTVAKGGGCVTTWAWARRSLNPEGVGSCSVKAWRRRHAHFYPTTQFHQQAAILLSSRFRTKQWPLECKFSKCKNWLDFTNSCKYLHWGLKFHPPFCMITAYATMPG